MSKKYIRAIVLVMLAFSALLFSGCAGDGEESFTLTFDADGGTLSFYSETLQLGEKINLPTAQKEGYRFCCFVYENGGEKSVFADENFYYRTNITVKAVWAPDDAYLINYDLSGGTLYFSDEKVFYYYTEGEDFTLGIPQKAREFFEGWYENEGETPQREAVIPKGSSGDRTFHAVFHQKSYTVSLVLKASAPNPTKEGEVAQITCLYQGRTEQTFKVDYGETLEVDNAVPTNPDYDFILWKYYDKNGDFVEFIPHGKIGAIVFNEDYFGSDFTEEIKLYPLVVGRYSPFV